MRALIAPIAGSVAVAAALVGGTAASSPAPVPDHAAATAGSGSHLPGTHCAAFPADDVWHASVRHLPVARRSDQWIASIGDHTHLHPDFGRAYGAQPVPYGIPISYVGRHHRRVRVRFRYGSESDHVRYPLGHDTRIEGGRQASGDRHAVVVDRSTCRLYETWDTRHTAHGWTAGSGATWSLTSDHLRPAGWTSADAAGLPILPGLLRWDEVKAGRVDHAIRFTAQVTARRYVWPARHEAGSTSRRSAPPMGARFRLEPGFRIAGYSRDARVVLRAMKTYGLILADNGSNWHFQGDASRHWPPKLIEQLETVPASAFQAVDESGLQVSRNSGRVR
jgi:hypothetical protein